MATPATSSKVITNGWRAWLLGSMFAVALAGASFTAGLLWQQIGKVESRVEGNEQRNQSAHNQILSQVAGIEKSLSAIQARQEDVLRRLAEIDRKLEKMTQ